MPVPQSEISPDERIARDERALRDLEMSRPDLTPEALAGRLESLLLDCPDRPDSPDDRL